VEDDLVATYMPWATGLFAKRGRIPAWMGRLLFTIAQQRAESTHARARRDLLDLDEQLGDTLAFAGRGE
jgi:hypothetical protein